MAIKDDTGEVSTGDKKEYILVSDNETADWRLNSRLLRGVIKSIILERVLRIGKKAIKTTYFNCNMILR